MSTEDKLKTVSPTFGNTVLPAVVGSKTKYQIVYADPAWDFGDRLRSSKKLDNGKKTVAGLSSSIYFYRIGRTNRIQNTGTKIPG